MERLGFFYRWYKQIGAVILVFIGFFLVFFSSLKSKDSYSHANNHDTNLLLGVAYADAPASSSSDSGDDGAGDCSDSGDSGGK